MNRYLAQSSYPECSHRRFLQKLLDIFFHVAEDHGFDLHTPRAIKGRRQKRAGCDLHSAILCSALPPSICSNYRQRTKHTSACSVLYWCTLAMATVMNVAAATQKQQFNREKESIAGCPWIRCKERMQALLVKYHGKHLQRTAGTRSG